jgi:hypothetical protein
MPTEPDGEQREDAEPPTVAPAEERTETAELDPEALALLRAQLARKYH